MVQVGFQHRSFLVVGVEARPFAEVVLKLRDQGAHGIGRAHRAAGDVARHQHDRSAGRAGDLGAHVTESLRFEVTARIDDPGEQLEAALAAHGPPRSASTAAAALDNRPSAGCRSSEDAVPLEPWSSSRFARVAGTSTHVPSAAATPAG